MDDIPAWAKAFAETVCACFNEMEGNEAGFEYHYCEPGSQNHDDQLFLFGPQLLAISGGPYNGEDVFVFLTVEIRRRAAALHAAGVDDVQLRTRRQLAPPSPACIERAGREPEHHRLHFR